MPLLDVAIIGCGEASKLHMAAIRKFPKQIRITAAVDPVRERAQQISHETGARVFSSFEQALAAGNFSAVILLLPHHLHRQYTQLALKAGKHVLLEKPMAMNLNECEEILEISRQTNGVFMVGENSQYWPEVVHARKQIQSGIIGIPILAIGHFAYPIYDKFERQHFWRFDLAKAGGGIVCDGGLHWIRILRLLMGEVTSVFARTLRTLTEMQRESLCIANFQFESGAIGTLSAMNISSAVGEYDIFRVTGTEGEIILRSGPEGGIGYDGKLDTKLMLYTKECRTGRQMMQPEGYLASFYGQYRDFLSVIQGLKPLEAGPDSAMLDIAIAHAIYKSVKLKENVILSVPELQH